MNFDKVHDRRSTASLKWHKYPNDVTPLWIADMDFPAPGCVQESLSEMVKLNIYGYCEPQEKLLSTIIQMLWDKYRWQVAPSSIVILHSLINGLNFAARSCVRNKNSVITHTPVYPPFLSAPILSGKKLVTNKLLKNNGRFEIDFDLFKKSALSTTDLYYLCNPHNPTGRVFSRLELENIAEICLKNEMYICSDEIHCDLILDKVQHVPFATLSAEIAQRTITLMSPGKTYNLPGLGFAFAIIENKELRQKFTRIMQGIVPHPSLPAIMAAEAAYGQGESWRLELISYLKENRRFVENFIAKNLPKIGYIPGEATYLAWLDMNGLKLENPFAYFLEHKVALSDGKDFGDKNYLRLNFACPLETLKDGLNKIKAAYDNLKI